MFSTSFQMWKCPSSLPCLCCCFKAFTGGKRPSSQPHQRCCFNAFQAKHVQAHYHPHTMLLFQCRNGGKHPHQCCCFKAFTRCKHPSSLHIPVLLFRCLSDKERPSSLTHTTPCCCFNAVLTANVQAHINHTSVAVSKPLLAANIQAHCTHQCCCFDASQAKNAQAHYHTHGVAVSML
jgi:hypothetical protein